MTSGLRRICLLAALTVSFAACERPDPEGAPTATAAPVIDGADSTPPTGPPTTESTPSSTAPTASTSPVSTVPRSTTTTAPSSPSTAPSTIAPSTTAAADPESPADLVLWFDGLGSLRFGRADADVVPILTDLLGKPVSDAVSEFPNDDEGLFIDDERAATFVAPFGREVCFANGLCAQFGAGSDTALQFVGWSYTREDAAGLATEDGITIGSRWSDHLEEMTVEPDCFTTGEGVAGGVGVLLRSLGAPFVEVDDDGTESPGDPDPADVVVTGLRAGELPISLEAGC